MLFVGKTQTCFSAIITASIFVLGMSVGYSDTIYKSIDEQGNVTYSSTPPDNAVKTKNIKLPKSQTDSASGDQQRRQQNMQEVTDDLAKSRAEREKQRAEQQAKSAEKKKEQQKLDSDRDSDRRDVYGYPPNITRPPIRPRPPSGPRPTPLPAR